MLSKNVGGEYLNRKFKCKMQMQIAIAKGKPKFFDRTQNFVENLKFSPKPISLSGTKKRFYSPMQTFSLAPAWAECKFFLLV